MATTVDDLIELKDQAVALAYKAVEAIPFVWGEPEAGSAMGAMLEMARAIVARDELYDAAEEHEEAVSIEDYEENHAPKETS